jgi:hypothetical protein
VDQPFALHTIDAMKLLNAEQDVCLQELRFDVRLLQRVPYEGVSRMRALSDKNLHLLRPAPARL